MTVPTKGAVQRIDNPIMAGMLAGAIKDRKVVTITPNDPQWERLNPRMKATVEAALKDAAKVHNCSEKDLEIKITFYKKGIPIIRVKKNEP